MLRENTVVQDRVFKLLDLGLTSLAFIAAYYVKKEGLPVVQGLSTGPNYYMVLMAVLVSSGLTFDFFRCHELYRQETFERVIIRLIKAVLVATAIVVFLLFLFKINDFSRLFLMMFVVFEVFLLTAMRAFVRQGLMNHRKKDFNRKKILVIGSRERACELISYISASEDLGYQILGCLDVEASRVGLSVAPNATIIGTMDQFNDILLHEAVDEVVFAMPLKKIDNALECIGFAEKLGVKVRVMPDWQIQKLMYQPEIASVYIENFVGIPTLALSSAPQKALELFIKSVLDRSVAAFGLVLLAPSLLVIAVLIKASSRGPVFFVQQRSGLNGRLFNLYKFRTMVVDAEELKAALDHENEMDGPVFKIKNDPRITRVGAFLRRTSLDELPQLINVLRGEMSLVGPRPPIPTEVEQYAPWQRRRLSMRPGLTCIWQVSGRNDISFEQWMNMDLEYIDKWSLLLDFKLLLKTVPAVVWGTGR